MAAYETSVQGQLMLISSPMMLLRLVARLAPSLAADLPASNRQYTDEILANALIGKIDAMPCAMRAERDDLMTTLDTIAVIASDHGNRAFMHTLIDQEPELKERFALYPMDKVRNAWTVGNVAAWIKLEGTEQMWDSLVTEASVFKDTKMQWMTFPISEPAPGCDRKAGLSRFCSEFGKLKKLEKRMDDYPVEVEWGVMPDATRYVFSTPCDPQIVKKFVRKRPGKNGQEVQEHRGEETERGRLVHDYGINENATGFIVDYYERAEYIRVSVVETSRNTRLIAESFVANVLKAKLLLNGRRQYYRVAPFRTRDYTRHLRIPDEFKEWVASVNVTALDMQYTDVEGRRYSPYVCHDCTRPNIFDDLEQVFPPDRFPPELRSPLGARVSVVLFKGHTNSPDCRPTKKTKTYTFDIGLRKFHWITPLKVRTKEARHHKILKRLIRAWDFEGLNADLYALGGRNGGAKASAAGSAEGSREGRRP